MTIGEEGGVPSVALAMGGGFVPDGDAMTMVADVADALFNAMNDLEKRGAEYRFVVIGDTPTKSEPEKKAPKGRKPRAPKTVDKSV